MSTPTQIESPRHEPGAKKVAEKLGHGFSEVAAKVTKRLVWVISLLMFGAALFWGITAHLVFGGAQVTFLGKTAFLTLDDFVILGMILSLIPPTILYFFDSKRKDSIDNNLPHLLRDIADAGRSGMTLTRAIEISAERDYGPLTRELRKLVAQLSFRIPLEKAISFFADRTGTMLARRSSMLIAEASKSGGDIQQSMEQVSEHVTELQYLEKKRRASMRPFIGIMYISFGVFLITVYLLVTSFFQALANNPATQGLQGAGLGGVSFVSVDLATTITTFLYISIVEGLFAGLVGGKMSTGRVKDGLKHAILLMMVSFFTFNFFV